MIRTTIALFLTILAISAPIAAPGSGIEDAIEVAMVVVLHRGDMEEGRCYWI